MVSQSLLSASVAGSVDWPGSVRFNVWLSSKVSVVSDSVTASSKGVPSCRITASACVEGT